MNTIPGQSAESIVPKQARAIGWGLAINIGRHGTRPHPFFGPAVQKNQGRVASAIKDAVAHVINRTGNV